MTDNRLSQLQESFLKAFFARNPPFFLTGGAALAGFYLGHRSTHDLDLFTVEDAMTEGMSAITEAAREMGAVLESIQTAPDFRRFLLRLGSEAIVIDLVRDYVPQVVPQKPIINGIRVDPPEEVFANKLCSLLSRSEIRDLVDVRALELAGYDLGAALTAAAKKDSGFTPAQLAWVLGQIEIGDDTRLPGEVDVADLRLHLQKLLKRLSLMAFPDRESQ